MLRLYLFHFLKGFFFNLVFVCFFMCGQFHGCIFIQFHSSDFLQILHKDVSLMKIQYFISSISGNQKPSISYCPGHFYAMLGDHVLNL